MRGEAAHPGGVEVTREENPVLQRGRLTRGGRRLRKGVSEGAESVIPGEIHMARSMVDKVHGNTVLSYV